MKEGKELNVSAIKNGTVIDHIPAQQLFKVIAILGLDQIDNQITFGTNLESRRLGRKAIIKVSDKYFAEEDINKIALVAPEANLNRIADYKVVEKKKVSLPDNIVGIVKCFNPRCVTNHENIVTRFSVVHAPSIELLCHYCERITDQENLQIIK